MFENARDTDTPEVHEESFLARNGRRLAAVAFIALAGTAGRELAYTGSDGKLPLVGAGLVVSGGLAAGASLRFGHHRADRYHAWVGAMGTHRMCTGDP